MSNSIAPGSSTDVNVKVTALTTNPNVSVTYKTIILKKNLVNGVNTLTQEMVNQNNVKYIIKYNFDLNGENVTIPEGCVLDFQGGKINNGVLYGNNSNVIAEFSQIFGLTVDFKGSWNINEVYPEWFGLTAYNKSLGKENVTAINKAIELQVLGAKKVVVNKGDIYIDVKKYENTWGINSPTIKLLSNSNVELKNVRIIVNENDFLGYYVFSAINVQNVKLNGGVVIGDVRNHAGNDGEFGYGLYIAGSKNIQVSNIEFNEFWGDGIILIYDSSNKSESSGIDSEKHSRNIYINNVKCLRNRRQGISICDGINVYISNSFFNETGKIKKTLPSSGMDLEPNGSFEFIENIKCVNCEFKDNEEYSVTSWYNTSTKVTDENLISAQFINCDFTSSNKISKLNVLTKNTTFTNCKFDEVCNATGTPNQGSYIIQDSEIKRVFFNGVPKNRIIKNCIFKDYNNYIKWDNLEFNTSYLIDCTFIVNNESIVYKNWGGGIYSDKIININPKIINIGDNSSYEMEVHKVQFIRPILINCKLFISTSKPKIITDNYTNIISNITTTTSISNGTVASTGKVPLFSYDEKWYDALGFRPGNKYGLHGERPSLNEEDGGYLFYNKSYKKWCYWDGTSWKGLGNDFDVSKVTKGKSSDRPSDVLSGFMYYDETLKKPIWWNGTEWIDATGSTV